MLLNVKAMFVACDHWPIHIIFAEVPYKGSPTHSFRRQNFLVNKRFLFIHYTAKILQFPFVHDCTRLLLKQMLEELQKCLKSTLVQMPFFRMAFAHLYIPLPKRSSETMFLRKMGRMLSSFEFNFTINFSLLHIYTKIALNFGYNHNNATNNRPASNQTQLTSIRTYPRL